jgi:signal transduction histidine kinase
MFQPVPLFASLRDALARGGPRRRLVLGWLALAALLGLALTTPWFSHGFHLRLANYVVHIDLFFPYTPALLFGLLFGFPWGAILIGATTALVYLIESYSAGEALFVALADPIDLFLLYYALRILDLKLTGPRLRTIPSVLFLSLFSSLAGSLQALAGSFLFDSLAVQRYTVLNFWEGWLIGSFLQKVALVLPLTAWLAPRLARFNESCRAGLPAAAPLSAGKLTAIATASLAGFGALSAYTTYRIVNHVFEPLHRQVGAAMAAILDKAVAFFLVLSGLGALGLLWVLGVHLLRETLRRGQERLELEREREQFWRHLVRSEKMGAIGTLAGGVAHEFNNILQGIMTAVDLALQTGRPQTVQFALQTAQQSCERASKLTRSLLSFSRRSGGARQPVDLPELVGECATLLERTLQKSGIEVKVDLPPAVKVLADRGAIAQTLLSLITRARNAVEGRPPPRKIAIQVAQTDSVVRLVVEDNGAGLSDEELGRMFEPFYSAAGVDQGMGLATVYAVIRDHGGRIDVTSTAEQGSRFTVTLPAAP